MRGDVASVVMSALMLCSSFPNNAKNHNHVRKRVRFADTSPLSDIALTSVKIISPNNSSDNLFAVKCYPSKAEEKVKPLVLHRAKCRFKLEKDTSSLVRRAIEKKICLENILHSQFAILGLVRVHNIEFKKEVTVRYTTNNWETYRDVWADYLSTSADKNTDKFTFRISMCTWLFEDNCNIEFALCYRVNGVEYWDNNDGKNYRISCKNDEFGRQASEQCLKGCINLITCSITKTKD